MARARSVGRRTVAGTARPCAIAASRTRHAGVLTSTFRVAAGYMPREAQALGVVGTREEALAFLDSSERHPYSTPHRSRNNPLSRGGVS